MKLVTIAAAVAATALVGCAAPTQDVEVERTAETEGAEENQPHPTSEVVAAPVETGVRATTTSVPRDSNDGAL